MDIEYVIIVICSIIERLRTLSTLFASNDEKITTFQINSEPYVRQKGEVTIMAVNNGMCVLLTIHKNNTDLLPTIV